ncbi:MAG: type II toxin-antitoxin system HicA family toxin [Deltaproteobacteria bacterium]|nr:type II toxin-antitoxin system HicA family toxin [Deltaproteobacteria bacterium]
MKRREFIRKLVNEGCSLYRRGSRHDIYLNSQTGRKAPVPRHQEIKNSLCALIRNQFGLSKE